METKKGRTFAECLEIAGIEIKSKNPKKPMTFDECLKASGFAGDEWRTIHGAHVEINENGEIIRGAGGKFNGSNISKPKAQKDEYKNKIRPMIKRPSGVVKQDVKTDRHGNPLPNVKVPETLDGAEGYFREMAWKTAGEALKYKDSGDATKQSQMGRYRDKYQKLADTMKEWTQSFSGGRSDVRESLKDTTTSAERSRIADRTVSGLFKYADEDPRGVGRWAAMNAYKQVENDLTPERKAYYSGRINKWTGK